MVTGVRVAQAPSTLTPNQIRGFWAAWGGWALDGMDASIYAVVLVPALMELLPRSGIAATAANIGYYGSILLALFLFGWGLSMVWGPIADRFGRVRALMLTILCYSLFTFLCALVTNIWQLAVLRVLCGIGIGGEQPIGGTFVAEEWPEDRRKMGAGYMHTGYYFGFFLAALANYFIGANFGWRWMFALGGAPALLVGWIRRGVHESATWQEKRGDASRRPSMGQSFMQLFSPAYRRRTIVNSLLFLVSIIGLWAGSIYVPTAVTQIALRQGVASADAARLASYGTGLLSIGTILGCVLLPVIAERLGRRLTMGLYFVLMGASIAIAFGYVVYIAPNALRRGNEGQTAAGLSIEPVLELVDATVEKDGRRVLDGITLTIHAGEHTAIVGPNGAGKSILVRLLTHEDRAIAPDAGISPVRVFGNGNWHVFDLRSQLGIISADLHHRFVAGNSEGRIAAETRVLSGFLASDGILRYGAITDDMRRRAADALDRMGIAHLARRWMDEMSSGEARRGLLPPALGTSPRALLLDEPTTGLDLAARHDFMERVRKIARDGTTLILITHHIDEIVPEIERVILLREGRIAAAGAKRSVLTAERLSDLFSAPIALEESDGYFYARPGGARRKFKV